LLDGYISDGVAMAAKTQGLETCGDLIDAIDNLGFDSVAIMLKSSGAMENQIESGVALIRRLRDTGEPHYNAIVKTRKGDHMGKVSKPSAQVLDVGAKFKTWSGLGVTSSIGFEISESREGSSLNRAKRLQELLFFFVDARIEVEIRVGKAAKDDAEGQAEFDDMTTVLIKATADSRSFGVSKDHYTGRLSFKTDNLPSNSTMRKLVNQPGRIIAKWEGSISEDASNGDDGDGDTPLLDGDDEEDGGNE
jgi:hypothetical protein